MTHGIQSTVAVIGAGIAGMSLARRLHGAGIGVTVIDRGRGPAGRMSTRRTESDLGCIRFDHGAGGFTATDSRFLAAVEEWVRRGVCARWAHRRGVLRRSAGGLDLSEEEIFVGLPGMNSICQHLGESLDCRYGLHVDGIEERGIGWRIHAVSPERSLEEDFEKIVVAAPLPQALRISLPECLAGHLPEPPGYTTVWAGMFTLGLAPAKVPEWIELPDDPVLTRLIRDGAKPGRTEPDGCSTWVVHANKQWSGSHREAPTEKVSEALVGSFRDAIAEVAGSETLSLPIFDARIHRWGLAEANGCIGLPCFWDPVKRIGVCGDGFQGAGVEGAFLSGIDLAERVIC